jgi:BioD-like phosphotransacetylase family protein
LYSKDHSGEKSVCDKKVEKKKVDDVITVTDRTSLLVVAALCAAEQVSLSELCLKLKKKIQFKVLSFHFRTSQLRQN